VFSSPRLNFAWRFVLSDRGMTWALENQYLSSMVNLSFQLELAPSFIGFRQV
jgi:hypothetical protein